VYNSIWIHDPDDLSDPEEEEDYSYTPPSNNSVSRNGTISSRERNEAMKRQDDIANAMWVQYQQYLAK
jgi:hypothetical protein